MIKIKRITSTSLNCAVELLNKFIKENKITKERIISVSPNKDNGKLI